MAKVLVYATALFFLLYGSFFTLIPVEMAHWITGASPAPASATIDFRATYGGAQFAIGLSLICIMRWQKQTNLALTVIAITLFSMAFARLLGILVDGQANLFMYLYLVAEVVFATWALYLKRSVTPRQS
ncbi:DUF4345 domain-containing protein [Shewanella sp. Scap07]|uniref:DUF4345 domain-containing protein n=1 Tax=Shewanella sp. Scap07 TaxID=2589987 RepID=UPI0015BC2C8D|nr:DUF4345 domain-containing protein [Shewanella sp. Scap07]QLE84819.1 DUF4345 domain-containing protein [Shewanella sp. Scap07]